MAIITLNEAKVYIDLPLAGKDYDMYGNTLISVVSNEIKTLCNQDIEQTTNTLEFCGNSGNMYMFPKFPVISVTSLKERNDPLDAFGSAITTSSYAILFVNKVYYLYYDVGYNYGLNNYQLVYISGYATVPEDIKLVAKEMFALYFKQSDIREGIKGGRLGVNTVTENFQGMSIQTQFKSMWDEWKLRLAKYRKSTV